MRTLFSRFGVNKFLCNTHLVALPQPSATEEEENVFDGKLGKLRYLGLAAMVATGAIAPDLVQLVLQFPGRSRPDSYGSQHPLRAPIAFPLLLGHVLTHVTVALCATCGRARALSDSLVVPNSLRTNWIGQKSTVTADAEGFIKLGTIARIAQVLFGALNLVEYEGACCAIARFDRALEKQLPSTQREWFITCRRIVQVGLNCPSGAIKSDSTLPGSDVSLVESACAAAASEACSFLRDASVIAQILVPQFCDRFHAQCKDEEIQEKIDHELLHSMFSCLGFERIDTMLDSTLMQDVLKHWVSEAFKHLDHSSIADDKVRELHKCLHKAESFHVFDWPCSSTEIFEKHSRECLSTRNAASEGICAASSTVQIAGPSTPPLLLAARSRKCVPLLGRYIFAESESSETRPPRIQVVPTSYTDLYAELGHLLPDCEQTAVCLVCGEVLDAGGKGECTRHALKCGAGAGVFFLLQECCGLIMHKNKAAFIHSPYVDSHGEAPQYRGRPLNLDRERYEHLREVWFSHGVRQNVMSERASMTQMIVPDFY